MIPVGDGAIPEGVGEGVGEGVAEGVNRGVARGVEADLVAGDGVAAAAAGAASDADGSASATLVRVPSGPIWDTSVKTERVLGRPASTPSSPSAKHVVMTASASAIASCCKLSPRYPRLDD